MTKAFRDVAGIWVAVIASAVAGCATGRLSGKDMVRLDTDPESACTYVGTVSGVNPWGATLDRQQDEVEWGRRDACEKAAELGATHVRFEPAALPGPAVAKAYRCPISASTASAAPLPNVAAPGCTKDLECKGDRICESGRCVDPARR